MHQFCWRWDERFRLNQLNFNNLIVFHYIFLKISGRGYNQPGVVKLVDKDLRHFSTYQVAQHCSGKCFIPGMDNLPSRNCIQFYCSRCLDCFRLASECMGVLYGAILSNFKYKLENKLVYIMPNYCNKLEFLLYLLNLKDELYSVHVDFFICVIINHYVNVFRQVEIY